MVLHLSWETEHVLGVGNTNAHQQEQSSSLAGSMRSTFLVDPVATTSSLMCTRKIQRSWSSRLSTEGIEFCIYDDAITDSPTASYLEAETFLNTIQALHIDGGKNSFQIMFLVGDQQLYDRVCVLVNRCPEQYSWVVPTIAGDFHCNGHVRSFFKELWFLPFTSTIERALGFEKVIKYKDDNKLTSSITIIFIYFFL